MSKLKEIGDGGMSSQVKGIHSLALVASTPSLEALNAGEPMLDGDPIPELASTMRGSDSAT